MKKWQFRVISCYTKLYQVISNARNLYPRSAESGCVYTGGIGSAAVGQTWQSSVRGEGGGYRRSASGLVRSFD